MANVNAPQFSMVFLGLGVSAVQRGQRGVAVLVVFDDTDTTKYHKFNTVSDFDAEAQAKFTPQNVKYIEDALAGVPLKLIVVRAPEATTSETLTEPFKVATAVAPRNCWMGLAEGDEAMQTKLSDLIKSENKIRKTLYKGLVFKAITPDNDHIVNFYNDKVTFADGRGEKDGEVDGQYAISYLLGYLAGLSLANSAVGVNPSKIAYVENADDLDAEVNLGRFILFTEDEKVKVVRGVNSLVTTGQNVTDDFKYILIIETQDLMVNDVRDTWINFYKGKYKNDMDNQLLFIGALNAYFKTLATASDKLLDINFDNKAQINIEQQRLANIPKYGEEEVNGWDDKKAQTMTVGTQMYLKANIKILNAMEDLTFNIYF